MNSGEIALKNSHYNYYIIYNSVATRVLKCLLILLVQILFRYWHSFNIMLNFTYS